MSDAPTPLTDEELLKLLAHYTTNKIPPVATPSRLLATVYQLKLRVVELEEALRPFAAHYEFYRGAPDGVEVKGVKVSDIQRASTALSAQVRGR